MAKHNEYRNLNQCGADRHVADYWILAREIDVDDLKHVFSLARALASTFASAATTGVEAGRSGIARQDAGQGQSNTMRSTHSGWGFSHSQIIYSDGCDALHDSTLLQDVYQASAPTGDVQSRVE